MRIERKHAERIADTEGAVSEGCHEVRDDVQLRLGKAEAHRCRNIGDDMDRHTDPLPIDANQPISSHFAQAGAKVQAARVRSVVKAHVRNELLAGAEARAGMRARSPAAGSARQSVVKLA
ncbi:hypothetical protein GCM10011487_20660 [Steroidobacter agaridevorans]|uniref:Uncharacterized protein n=1 Tax=Steroidobacter agaridevorans TaxID=2695856 RepID=A0A829YBM5_9GAMM|nr:hypothetical protein GCM10011487_20660 [Steroidobacter agaridevorans]GFE89965.1 hypothetical protein GCM10011488_49190 [Steroidobacter agaridevorans]